MTSESPVISQFLPIQTVSELNRSEHWTVSAKRHKNQRRTVKLMMPKSGYPNPCRVMLVRCGGRTLDSHDNLPASFKWIVDAISSLIVESWEKASNLPAVAIKRKKRLAGRDDDDPRLEWKYEQNTKAPKGVLIEIFPK